MLVRQLRGTASRTTFHNTLEHGATMPDNAAVGIAAR